MTTNKPTFEIAKEWSTGTQNGRNAVISGLYSTSELLANQPIEFIKELNE
jgi:hypothetical protein